MYWDGEPKSKLKLSYSFPPSTFAERSDTPKFEKAKQDLVRDPCTAFVEARVIRRYCGILPLNNGPERTEVVPALMLKPRTRNVEMGYCKLWLLLRILWWYATTDSLTRCRLIKKTAFMYSSLYPVVDESRKNSGTLFLNSILVV